ncbi:MAG: ribosome-associated ATPase/putative transporter RbbA [Kiloniellales bacterium]
MTEVPSVEIQAVSHRYRKLPALEEVSLTIPGGCLVGVIGPDGVGKSTLLGLIAGAKRLQTGRIEVLGGNIGEANHRRRVCTRIAYMPQGLGKNLYAELTVRENLDFFGRLFRQGGEERAQRIAALLAATGLAPFVDRPAGKLSGGMKQKLGLCSALIHDPDLLVLDEPTTGVDPLSRRQFWQLLAHLRERRAQMSLIVSTAYIDEAEGFDWLVAMDGGRALTSGSPQELVARTGAGSLEAAYRSLLPGGTASEAFVVPPRDQGSAEPVIQAVDLTRRFGDFVAVDKVSFEIERGEIFGFLGSNGCGKTTTMKMLTGLLPVSAGEARLFGRPVKAEDREARRDIGYMSQTFSLYGELTVQQNLALHARVFGLPKEKRQERIVALTTRFGLAQHLGARPQDLPLGLRQRLSLAVAVIHEPKVLILDEPTSGVDPEARDDFWRLLLELSREQGVTIFVSTHFMSEAMRCDRISLMHAGRVLACDKPERLIEAAGAETLEEAFIAKLQEVDSLAPPADEQPMPSARPHRAAQGLWFSWERLSAYARREGREVLRDPVRLAFAFFGSALLMVVFCYGISLDVEDLTFAVLDLDQSPESRTYSSAFEGSRYFTEAAPLASPSDALNRLTDGSISLALEIPPDFGRSIARRGTTEVLAIVDGAMPYKGETIEGYVAGIHDKLMSQVDSAFYGDARPLAEVETRFRYNPSFESINAMAPGMPAILLILLPAILTAVSVARERELGSIANFYVTPTTRLEFLVGKQAPYILISFANFILLAVMTVLLFGVPLKGSVLALALGGFFYVWGTTAFGLVISTLTTSQVAAVFATALSSVIPTIQFSGLLQPVSTLEGGAQVIGSLWPASHFLHLSVGAFTKGLGWEGLAPDIVKLAVYGPAFTLIAALALRGQER